MIFYIDPMNNLNRLKCLEHDRYEKAAVFDINNINSVNYVFFAGVA